MKRSYIWIALAVVAAVILWKLLKGSTAQRAVVGAGQPTVFQQGANLVNSFTSLIGTAGGLFNSRDDGGSAVDVNQPQASTPVATEAINFDELDYP